MAAYTVGKFSNFLNTKKYAREILLTFTRNRQSWFLGYYKRRLRTPVFRQRQKHYRETILMPLEEIPTLEDKLKALNAPDPVFDAEIDIGFLPKIKTHVPIQERLEWYKKMAELKSKLAVEEKLVPIDLSEVNKEWREGDGSANLRNIATHYGIFKHLYEHGVFTPCVPMKVTYDINEDTVTPVYMGNILEASDVSKVPDVSYASKPDDLWTLILTNLDGHLLDTSSEYLHWFVGNIQGNELKSGEVICDYLQPFPMRGTGYHRLVFVLYKQDKKIDFSSLKKASPCLSLEARTFRTFNFYKEYQDSLTPAGLAFFQCTWDESLTDFFHNVLNMQEPVFEYIQPPMKYKDQIQFPHLQPFNLYLDRYRDPKEMKKEVLLKRLKTVEPFKEEAPMPKYPCLHKPEGYKYSWQKKDFEKQRLRLGRYRDLRPHSVYPQEDNQFEYDKFSL